MALFQVRVQSLLALAFCSIMSVLSQFVHGGRLFRVGGAYGWNFALTIEGSGRNYQDWTSSLDLRVGDALDFGDLNVMLVPSEAEETCNASIGKLISPNGTDIVLYNFTGPGQFGFISPVEEHCLGGMKFSVNVSTNLEGHHDSRLGSVSPSSEPPNVANHPHSTPCGSSPGMKKYTCLILLYGNLVGWIGGLVAGSAIALILMACMTRRRRSRSSRKSLSGQDFLPDLETPSSHSKDLQAGDAGQAGRTGPHSFLYEELERATQNFNPSLVVGEGGFGTVYKAYLGGSPGYPMAVKRMSKDASQGAREFMAEVNIFAMLRHPNLVQLLGWCDEHEELLLVYEYMPNGDLDDLIFGGYRGDQDPEFSPLAWTRRYNIFCGVAKALVYLHEEWEQQIVHRDVKTSNVLLDSEFNGRLGDFGLARLSSHGQALKTTVVAGTMGYLDPEYLITGRASDKTDVYAFGMVVLEVSCARRPYMSNSIPLLDWVWDLHKEDELLDAIDPKLDRRSLSIEEDLMKRALQVGLLCCHPDPEARPTMRVVLNILRGNSPLPILPK